MVATVHSDYNDERKFSNPPFASGDSSLLVDIDFRDGVTAVTAAMTAAGFTLYGTGHLWDATRGWNPNLKGGFSNTNWVPTGHASLAAAFASGEATIYCEVERAALSCTWMDDDSFFTDSQIGPSASCWNGSSVVAADHLYGDYTVGTKIGYAFRSVTSTGLKYVRTYYQCGNNLGNPAGRVYFGMDDNVNDQSFATRAIGRAPDLDAFDPDFAEIIYSIKNNILKVYVDRRLVKIYRLDATFVLSDLFYRNSVGSEYTTTRALAGYIRRYQLANAAAEMKLEGPRIAFVGDSFTQRGTNMATPADDPDIATVADVDAVQNSLVDWTLEDTSDVRLNPIIASVWRPWLHELCRVAANEALPFSLYDAGAAGRGWADTGSSTPLNPIPTAFFDAVVAHQPEIIVCTGSTNDVDGATNIATDYLAECKAKIAYMISNSYTVRKLYFFETWPGWKGKTNHSAADYIAEWTRQRELQAQLDGYTVANASGADVVVEFVSTYDKIGGDNYSANFNIGGSEYAPLWDALYTQSLTMTDLHPSQYGHDLMVKVYWDALKNNFLNSVVE